jgi:hypothetical protein
MRLKLARTLVLVLVLTALWLFGSTSSALAYGNTEQWQIGFSGSCNNTSFCGPGPGVPGAFGFWGWCAFGGSSGSEAAGTTGSTADCQFTTYFRTTGVTNSPVHISFDVSRWVILPPGVPFAPPGVPTFAFTSGTFEVTGPGAGTGGLPPAGMVVSLPNPCPPQLCDTGLPSIPGHYSFHPVAGVEFNIQVTKLP